MSFMKKLAATLLLAASTCAVATPPTPAFIVGTAPLTAHEMDVSRAYLALFGRAPELGGLNYWAGQTASNATFEQVYDAIAAFASYSGVSPANENNLYFVRYVYAFVLGKSYADDPSGVQFWACQLSNDGSQVTEPINGSPFCLGGYANRTRGDVLNSLFAAAAGTPDPYSHDIFANRMLALEFAGRIQKARGNGFTYSESATLMRRVMNTDASFNDAMDDLDRVTQGGTSTNPVKRFDLNYTATSLYNEARPAALNSNVKVHKYLVWYNGNRDMLLAQAYFPPNFLSGSNFQAVVSVHGGGWRNGWVEYMEDYNTALAAQGFVVLSPMYRLTSWGGASPTQETDIADFAAVVKAKASTFKVNSNKVRLFGHSAGGHLAALRGTQSNYGCVATVAAPLDLVGDFTTGPMNTALNYYVVPPATRASVSPSAQSTSASSTKFLVHFGNIDGLVPPSQAATFQAAFGSGRVQTVAYNESHMFTTAGMNAVASATSAFFQGSSCP